VAAVIAVAAVGAPASADAHLTSGTVAVDFRATVSPPRGGGATAVVRARVSATDRALALTVAHGHTATVLSASGATLMRVDARGAHSGRTVVWHDARLRGLPAGVRRARWVVPLVVDGARSRVEGSIWRVRAPRTWPWLLLGLPFALSTALVARSPKRLASACSVFAVLAGVASLAIALSFGASSTASPGLRLESFDEIVFVAVAVVLLLRFTGERRTFAAAAAGLLALVVGGLKITALGHGVVLSVLPAAATRAGVALALWSGVAAAALAAGLLAGSRNPRVGIL
jgi:hypothetical protein